MPSLRHHAPSSIEGNRWPPLLLALRRAARPDRARVAAYLALTSRPSGWAAYTEFLAVHRAWIAALDRTLDEAGAAPRGPLPDGADAFDAVQLPDAAQGGLAAPASGAHALGYLSVLEAFRVGCAVLARRIRGLAEPLGGAPLPDQTLGSRAWGALVEALGDVPPEQHPAVIQGAREAFSAWERRLAGALAHLGIGPLSAGAHAA